MINSHCNLRGLQWLNYNAFETSDIILITMYSENVKNMPYHITISFVDSLWVLIQFFHILGCRTLYIFFSFVYWVPDLIGSEVKLLLFVMEMLFYVVGLFEISKVKLLCNLFL